MSEAANKKDRLESWKQIAAYLGRSERTARRWHETEAMPVYRHVHLHKGSVWAYPDELDAWLKGRGESAAALPVSSGGNPDGSGPPQSRRPSRRWIWPAVPVVCGLLLGALATSPDPPEPALQSETLAHLAGATYGADFSPDGQRSVFYWGPRLGRTQGLYLKTLDSEEVVPLTSRDAMDNNTRSAYRGSPAWSPDGGEIAYLRRTKQPSPGITGASPGITELCFASAFGHASEECPVSISEKTRYWGHLRHLAWTPDGKWVVTPMNHGERQGVFAVSRSTLEVRQISEQSSNLQAIALSPDGRKLAYLRTRATASDGTEHEIVRQNLTTDLRPSGAPAVLHRERTMPDGIAWTPDGTELMACLPESRKSRDGTAYGLYRLNTDSGRSRSVDLAAHGACSSLNITRAGPNRGSILSFSVGTPYTGRLMHVRLDGRGGEEPSNFLHSGRLDHMPSHSPDGKQVAFLSDRSGQPEIWIADADGRNPRRLTRNSGVSWSSPPKWSRDGQRILYAGDPTGTGTRLLLSPTTGAATVTAVPVPEKDPVDPSWSEDGAWIYYRVKSSIRKVRVSGGESQRVLEWPPDTGILRPIVSGGYVYFMRYEGMYTMLRRRIDSGQEERLASGLASTDFAIAGSTLHVLQFENWRRVIYAADLTSVGAGSITLRRVITLPEYEGINQLMEGFSVSPDGTELVFTVSGESRSEIRMVKNFR